MLGWVGTAAGLSKSWSAVGAGCLKVQKLLLGEAGTSAVVDAVAGSFVMLEQSLLVWLLVWLAAASLSRGPRKF